MQRCVKWRSVKWIFLLLFFSVIMCIWRLQDQVIASKMFPSFDLHTIVRFTLNSSTRIIEFRGFLSQFSTNFHEILHTLFSIHVVTTLTISRSFDKYLKS